jgi:hypothetical protein
MMGRMVVLALLLGLFASGPAAAEVRLGPRSELTMRASDTRCTSPRLPSPRRPMAACS